MKILHRVSFQKKSVYCGYDEHSAAKAYFEKEPEATPAEPVNWWMALVDAKNPNMIVEQKTLRESTGASRA